MVLAVAVLVWDVGLRPHHDGSSVPAVWTTPLAVISAEAPRVNEAFAVVASGNIPMPANTPAAHASTLLAMPATSAASVLAFWFAGQRESAPDVQIAFSWFDRATAQWTPARFVVNKEAVGKVLGFGVRRLGNPVAWLDTKGRVHLFVVATGLGGWAAGRVLHLQQKESVMLDGHALNAMVFEPVRVLPLSWLWNTSHLVRSAPLALADGGMLLPLYFELGIKYPVAARLGPTGEFLGLQRLSRRGSLLQPTLVMQDATHWLAFLRDHSPERKVAVVQTTNAGLDWQDLPNLTLDNPDASVAGLGLRPGLMVMAYNPSTTGRQTLDLSTSANGLDWHTVATLAQGGDNSEFSYPALTWADDSLWVSYTDQRKRIAWQRLALAPALTAAQVSDVKP